MTKNWTPHSPRNKPIKQVPFYPDAQALNDVEARLRTYPPLVLQVKRVSSSSNWLKWRKARHFCSGRRLR